MPTKRTSEAGFSMVELLVAMVVTLVVAGSIFGLMSSGQSSFQRDPQISERQQNIRVAMDLVQRDLQNAGMSMGSFAQAFLTGLDNLAAPAGAPSAIFTGERTDALQIFGSDGMCPDILTDSQNPYSGANVNMAGAIPSCYQDDDFVFLIYSNGNTKWGFGHNIHAQNMMMNFPPGLQPPTSQIQSNEDMHCRTYIPPACSGGDDVGPARIAKLHFVRYEIANDATGIPCLWRSETAGVAGGVYAPAGPGSAAWQLVSRGIDDLQVFYTNLASPGPLPLPNPLKPADPPPAPAADATVGWATVPVLATSPNFNTITRQVAIVLSARTIEQRLAGARTTVAGGTSAMRGQLVSMTAPRAALFALSTAPLTPTPDPSRWE